MAWFYGTDATNRLGEASVSGSSNVMIQFVYSSNFDDVDISKLTVAEVDQVSIGYSRRLFMATSVIDMGMMGTAMVKTGIANVKNTANATVSQKVPLTQSEFDRIINLEKNNRPLDVTDYLDKKYVANHLAKFEEQGGAFIQIQDWIKDPKYIAYQSEGKFVGLPSEMELIISKYKASGNNWKILRDELNLGANVDLSNSKIVYVKLPPKDPRFKYSMPTGNEIGAYKNEWVPGGFTKNGTSEAILSGGDKIIHNNNVNNLLKLFPDTSELLQ